MDDRPQAELELARKNLRWGWALFGLFLRAVRAAPSASRSSTSGSTERRGLDHRARRRPAGPAARGEGSLRHGRHPLDVRVGGVRRPRAVDVRRVGRRARGARLGERRQDEPARVRVRRHVAEPALRRRPEPALPGADRRAARAAARRRRSCSALADGGARHRHGRLDPHPGRVLRRRRASSRRTGSCRRRRLPARADVRPRGADGARPSPAVRRCSGSSVPSVSPTTCGSRRAWGGVRGEPIEFPTAEAVGAGVHARGRRRAPRAVRGATASSTARTSAARSSGASR